MFSLHFFPLIAWSTNDFTQINTPGCGITSNGTDVDSSQISWYKSLRIIVASHSNLFLGPLKPQKTHWSEFFLDERKQLSIHDQSKIFLQPEPSLYTFSPLQDLLTAVSFFIVKWGDGKDSQRQGGWRCDLTDSRSTDWNLLAFSLTWLSSSCNNEQHKIALLIQICRYDLNEIESFILDNNEF